MSVAIDVRCDRDEEGDAGRYQVHAEGHVGRESKEGLVEAKIPVSIEVNDADGGLKLDSDAMREEIANAIRSTGRRARGVSLGTRARRARHAFSPSLARLRARFASDVGHVAPLGQRVVARRCDRRAPSSGTLRRWSGWRLVNCEI